MVMGVAWEHTDLGKVRNWKVSYTTTPSGACGMTISACSYEGRPYKALLLIEPTTDELEQLIALIGEMKHERLYYQHSPGLTQTGCGY